MGPVQQLLYHNAGFSASLLALEAAGALDAYAPRYDPTVVPRQPATAESATAAPATTTPATAPARGPETLRSAQDYVAAYRHGTATPLGVAERITALLDADARLATVFISTVPRDQLLSAARASTGRYAAGTPLPLDGVPLVVKDELDVAGLDTTLGLSAAEAARRGVGEAARQTSWCVQQLLDAGMLLLGKTNMHELGLDTTGHNPHWGTPPNPYAAGFYPGGSSAGSAAAVGAGLAPIAVAADGGGSIRLPAAYCGVFGLKPSHGRLSAAPSRSLAPSVGVYGPIAATMADLELAYRLMAAPDAACSFPAPPPQPSPSPPGARRVLGIYKPWFDDCDAVVAQHTAAAVAALTSRGGYVAVDIALPHLAAARHAHTLTILAEICGVFCRGDTHGLTPGNRVLVAVGTRAPARELLLAQQLRSLLMSHMAALFQLHPGLVVVSPTVPHAGVPIAPGSAERGRAGVSDANTSLRSMQYAFLANLTGCPAISLPVGYCPRSGMPIGLMGMAEWGAEDALLQLGRAWEGLWDCPEPPSQPPSQPQPGPAGSPSAAAAAVTDVPVGGGRRRGTGWVDVLGV